MDFLLTTFFFVVIIGFLVFIHELGHFLAAKVSGIYVYEFSIGFGPSLIEKKFKETNYKIALLPLGGYVQLEGEQDSSHENGFRNKPFYIKLFVLSAGVIMNLIVAFILLSVTLVQNNYKALLPNIVDYSFNAEQTQEIYPVYIANPAESFGWEFEEDKESLLIGYDDTYFEDAQDFTHFLETNAGETVEGKYVSLTDYEEFNREVAVGSLGIDTFAVYVRPAEGGRSSEQFEEAGEIVIGINNRTFTSVAEFLDLIEEYEESIVPFTFLTEEGEKETRRIEIFEAKGENNTRLDVGVGAYYGIDYTGAFGSPAQDGQGYLVSYADSPFSFVGYMVDTTLFQLKGLGSIFGNAFESGDFSEVEETTGGIVRVGDTIGDIVSLGVFDELIPFTALISLSLAIFNILPIPALDGGQIMIFGIESATRKKIPDTIIGRINLGGFIFVSLLGILIIFVDLKQVGFIEGLQNFFESVLGR